MKTFASSVISDTPLFAFEMLATHFGFCGFSFSNNSTVFVQWRHEVVVETF